MKKRRVKSARSSKKRRKRENSLLKPWLTRTNLTKLCPPWIDLMSCSSLPKCSPISCSRAAWWAVKVTKISKNSNKPHSSRLKVELRMLELRLQPAIITQEVLVSVNRRLEIMIPKTMTVSWLDWPNNLLSWKVVVNCAIINLTLSTGWLVCMKPELMGC